MAGAYTPKSGQFAGETFSSYRQYRNAVAQAEGFRNYSQFSNRTKDPVYRYIVSKAAESGLSEKDVRKQGIGKFTGLSNIKGQNPRDNAVSKQEYREMLENLDLTEDETRVAWRRFYRGDE